MSAHIAKIHFKSQRSKTIYIFLLELCTHSQHTTYMLYVYIHIFISSFVSKATFTANEFRQVATLCIACNTLGMLNHFTLALCHRMQFIHSSIHLFCHQENYFHIFTLCTIYIAIFIHSHSHSHSVKWNSLVIYKAPTFKSCCSCCKLHFVLPIHRSVCVLGFFPFLFLHCKKMRWCQLGCVLTCFWQILTKYSFSLRYFHLFVVCNEYFTRNS